MSFPITWRLLFIVRRRHPLTFTNIFVSEITGFLDTSFKVDNLMVIVAKFSQIRLGDFREDFQK